MVKAGLAGPVLVLGGYGVFGGKLTRRLTAAGVDVVVAGRSLDRARAHCARHGGRPYKLDRAGDLAAAFAALKPSVVIDAAGPFQAYGDDPYRVARAAIAHGAHYLDLADDAEFVAGISEVDVAAREAGLTALSGASSVPAISSAALDALTAGMTDVGLVRSTILPGNRAPRGLSVMQAIVTQAGRQLAFWRGGTCRAAPAWGDLRRVTLALPGHKPLNDRLASPIDAPDRLLFPARYGARSALFRAGLELKVMHVGLWALGFLPRLGLMGSLDCMVPCLKWIAHRLERFGSDRGGMEVTTIGRRADGQSVERRWTLIAEGGAGPEIPPTPALLLALKLRGLHDLAPGARPAVGALTLDEIERALAQFAITCGRDERSAPVLMEQVLPDDFSALPAQWRRLAEVHDIEDFAGEGSVERGKSLLSRIVGRAAGFPPAGERLPVTVTKEKTSTGEVWTRRFGARSFRSVLSRKPNDPPGLLRERFGAMTFRLKLKAENSRVEWPVVGWSVLGLPMPRWLAPTSLSSEQVDEDGRFRFDVAISLPIAGFVVRYRGWLAPAHETQAPIREKIAAE